MLKIVSALLDLLGYVGRYFANQQLINAGKAEQQVAVQEKVEENVQNAAQAVATPDVARTERLRNRFDDAAS